MEPPTPPAREFFRFHDQARTLETIAAPTGAAFDPGALAEVTATDVEPNGGAMNPSAPAAHANDWAGTISRDYRGLTVHEIPPNGQGIVCLMALGILSSFDLADHPLDSADP